MSYQDKYLKYKNKYLELKNSELNNIKGGGKYDKLFQLLIDNVGKTNILESFIDFLGRNDVDFYTQPEGLRATRNPRVNPDFTGLAFDGAHWKGYENGVVTYDSYAENVQLPKTNNYCQSYAAFLFASKGLTNNVHNVTLVPGKYVDNVKIISDLWLKYFTYMGSFEDGKDWINAATNRNIHKIIGILKELSTNINCASEFSISAE
jgi:hypothetical protein